MPVRPGWKYVPSIVSLLAIALIAANYFTPFADLDFTWQIRTGEEIVRTGDLRSRDAFTYTIAGKDVPEFEGLYGVGLWAVWNVFGYGGLKLLRVLLVGGPLLLVGLRLRGRGCAARRCAVAGRPRPGGGAGLEPATALPLHHRPSARQRPAARPLRRPTPPALVAAAADAGLGQPPSRRRHGPGTAGRRHRLGMAEPPAAPQHAARPPRPVAADLAGRSPLAATFVSPDPIGRLLYPFSAAAHHPILQSIPEMQPLVAFALEAPFAVALVYAVAALTAWTVVRPVPPIPPLGNRSSGRPGLARQPGIPRRAGLAAGHADAGRAAPGADAGGARPRPAGPAPCCCGATAS